MAQVSEEQQLADAESAANSLVADSGPMVRFVDMAETYEPADLDEGIAEWNAERTMTERPVYLDPADDPSAKQYAEGEMTEDEAAESLLGDDQEQAEDEGQEAQEPEVQDLQFETVQDLIEHYELADPDAAVNLVMELTNGEAESSPETIDAVAMSNTLTRAALASAQAYDQLSPQIDQLAAEIGIDALAHIPPVPAESAQQFANDFISSWGYDPSQVPHDPQILADTVNRGNYNIIRSWMAAGQPEDISGLNEPGPSQMFMAGLLAAFGQDVSPEQIDPQHAVAFCDRAAKVVLGSVAKSVSLADQRRANPVRQGMRSYQQWNKRV